MSHNKKKPQIALAIMIMFLACFSCSDPAPVDKTSLTGSDLKSVLLGMEEYKNIVALRHKAQLEIENEINGMTASQKSDLKNIFNSFSSAAELRKYGTNQQIDLVNLPFRNSSTIALDESVLHLISNLREKYKVDFKEVFSLIYSNPFQAGRTKVEAPRDCEQVRTEVFWDQVERYFDYGFTPQQAYDAAESDANWAYYGCVEGQKQE